MYVNFFNLEKEPFNPTPDPAFLFPTATHREALGAIVFGIKQRKGFILITGEVGTGKTTIIRSCLENLDRDAIKLAYLFNPDIRINELLDDMFRELGIESENRNLHDMIERLHKYLIAQYRRRRTVVLIIDEAQNIPVNTMENLRVLSNLETTEDKLLQIVLVGQPEIHEKLDLYELRQLNQRIAVRTMLQHLTTRESEAYIRHRLEVAGARLESVFTRGAVEKITFQAKGVPRVLNILCDLSLVAGFGYQQKPITERIAAEVIEDYLARPPLISDQPEYDALTASEKAPAGASGKTAGGAPRGLGAPLKPAGGPEPAQATRVKDRRLKDRRHMMTYVYPDRRMFKDQRVATDRRSAWRPPEPDYILEPDGATTNGSPNPDE